MKKITLFAVFGFALITGLSAQDTTSTKNNETQPKVEEKKEVKVNKVTKDKGDKKIGLTDEGVSQNRRKSKKAAVKEPAKKDD